MSRNPQWLGMAAMLLGACVAIGSWTAVMLWLVSAVGYHFRILGEETACAAQYGAEYGTTGIGCHDTFSFEPQASSGG